MTKKYDRLRVGVHIATRTDNGFFTVSWINIIQCLLAKTIFDRFVGVMYDWSHGALSRKGASTFLPALRVVTGKKRSV